MLLRDQDISVVLNMLEPNVLHISFSVHDVLHARARTSDYKLNTSSK